jgi:uncharacterized membrane protein
MQATEGIQTSRPRRITTRMASGIVALIPIVITVAVLRFVFNLTAGILLPIVEPAVGEWHPLARGGLSLVILVAGIYLLGELATHVVGRKVLSVAEDVVLKVPFVKVVYSVSKQVVGAFQGRGTRAFKSVVFVAFPHPGLRSVGFITSSFRHPDGSDWSTVFVPTTPNPTTGFLQLVPTRDLEHTEMTVEEGVKMVMSIGVLMPD